MNYAPELAGVGRYTAEIAEDLARRGGEVIVVTTPAHYPGWRVQEPYSRIFYAVEQRNGVKVIRCPLALKENIGGIWRLIAPLTFALTSAPVILWQMLRHRPSLALSIVPTLLGAPLLLLAARLAGSRTVLHIQDLEVDAAFAIGHLGDYAWLKNFAWWFERRCMSAFQRVVTISDKMAEKIALKGVDRRKIAVVRNWVDLDLIQPLKAESPYRAELQIRPDEFVVLYSGNLGHKQGLALLLRAAERLAGQHGIRFVVAGEGPVKGQLIARYGALPHVSFLPFQPYNRLSDFLGMADLHVLPQESSVADLVLPSKLGGMLASGRPIVVMAEVGTEMMTFLKDSVTVVVPGDFHALAGAILAASRDRKEDPEKALLRCRLANSLSKSEGLSRFAQAVAG